MTVLPGDDGGKEADMGPEKKLQFFDRQGKGGSDTPPGVEQWTEPTEESSTEEESSEQQS